MISRLICLLRGHRRPVLDTELYLGHWAPRVQWRCPRCRAMISRSDLR